MYFLHFSPTLFGHSTTLPRAVNLLDVLTDGLLYKAHLREALPTFLVKCACVFPSNLLLRGPTPLQSLLDQ